MGRFVLQLPIPPFDILVRVDSSAIIEAMMHDDRSRRSSCARCAELTEFGTSIDAD